MTKTEAERRSRMNDALRSLGFTRDECESLRRISMQLHSWHERECGTDTGCVERDEMTGKTYWLSSMTGKRYPVRDMETGALKRLARIVGDCNEREDRYKNGDGIISAYVQTDPRGAALYILRPGDVPEGGKVDAYYSRGICVY